MRIMMFQLSGYYCKSSKIWDFRVAEVEMMLGVRLFAVCWQGGLCKSKVFDTSSRIQSSS